MEKPESNSERLLAIVRQTAQETYPGQDFNIRLDSSLEDDLGLDSLTRVELVHRINRAFDTILPDKALLQACTPRDLLQLLDHRIIDEGVGEIQIVATGSKIIVPAELSTLTDVLNWHVKHSGERIHVLSYGDSKIPDSITYAALHNGAMRIAGGLVALGLLPGQTVALMLATGRDYLEAFFGVLFAGGVPVPIYPPAHLAQLSDHLKRQARILRNAGAVYLISFEQASFAGTQLQSQVETVNAVVSIEQLRDHQLSAPVQVRGNDLALLQYTSGSTGDPKGVMLSHANLLANIRAMGKAVNASSEDVFVSWLPMYHDMGLIGAWFCSLYYGMPLVLMSPTAFLARPVRWLRAITRHRGTLSGGPNFAYDLCNTKISTDEMNGLDLSSWRFAFNGAEPVSPTTLVSFEKRFLSCGFRRTAISPLYGLAENAVGLAFSPLDRGPRIDKVQHKVLMDDGIAIPAKAEDKDFLMFPACGYPLSGHEIRIVNDDGVELPERHVGRLEFRGPSATKGYYRNKVQSEHLIHNGWLDSADNAYLADGEVFITGRIKDVIFRGGRNLYPYDLEEAIGNLEGVRKGRVAVFNSVLNGRERVIALVETRLRDETSRVHLKAQIPPLAITIWNASIDEIVLAPPGTVLKTSSGKIRRSACRDAYEKGQLFIGYKSLWQKKLQLVLESILAHLRIALRHTLSWYRTFRLWAVTILIALPVLPVIVLLNRPALGWKIAHIALKCWRVLSGLSFAAVVPIKLPHIPHILISNHASYLDVFILTALLPGKIPYRFIAKKEFSDSWLRFVLNGLGVAYVERFDAKEGADDVERMQKMISEGHNLIVFPEGTFTREAGLRPFRLGAFVASAQTGASIVVSALRGTRFVLRDGSWRPQRGDIQFELGPVLKPTGNDWQAAIELRDEARLEILKICGEYDRKT